LLSSANKTAASSAYKEQSSSAKTPVMRSAISEKKTTFKSKLAADQMEAVIREIK